ncbi:TonB-dependent receptor [candidate division KSB1 bacterium]|nr:TonB-dependent receptor [candidate division KSB1 bacterium]
MAYQKSWMIRFGAILIIACSVPLWSGTTGKIAGEIIDQETNQLLIGTNVMIENTLFGAASGMDGYYNIINLPPGIYTMRATMMGYKPMVVENVRVSIDRTTQIHFTLTPSVVQTDEAVVVVAKRPLVRPDMTSSMSSVSAEEIEALPVTNLNDLLELQAGVVRSGNDLHIRGGRAGEVAFWVDGVAATDLFSGNMGVSVENSAIQELQVVSGTFNAEYGQAMSGIVNIITKEGSPDYHGKFSSYIGDYISSDKVFNVLTEVDITEDPETGAISVEGIDENPIKKFNQIYNSEFNLSGPVPLLGNKLTFFMNGRYQSNEGHIYGRDWFTPQGNPGDSNLVSLNPNWRYSGQAKLTWRANPNLKISYNLFHNYWQNDRSGAGVNRHDYRYNPYGLPKQQGGGTSHTLAWNHVLSNNTFYEARINRFLNEYEYSVYDNPLQACDYLVRVTGDTVRGVYEFDPTTPEGQARLDQIRQDRIGYIYVVDPSGSQGYVHPDSNQTPTSYSFLQSGMSLDQYKRSSAYWLAKIDLTSQVDQAHQVKTGFEVRLHELSLHSYALQSAMDGNEIIIPFEPAIPAVGNVNRHDYTQKPREFSTYIQDKIELKDINVNIGVRFDYFDPNTVAPADPHDPNIYTPFKKENIYRDWIAPPSDLTQEERDDYISQFEEYTPDERRAFMQKKISGKWAISPRLGFAFPITDQGVIHFSYGHFFQVPDFEYLFDNPDFKLSAGGGYTVFGNPDLKPERTVQYEIGLQQQLTENIGVDVTLFYKDIRDWVGTSPLIDTEIPSVKYSQFENRDYANVRGITVKMNKRFSYNFSASLDYSYQIAEGTYANPRDAFNAIQNQQEPRLAMISMPWDQNHTLNGNIIYRLNTWTFSLKGRYWTGRPYSPTFPVGQSVGGAALIGLKENSERLPDQKRIDMTINKRIKVGGFNLEVFTNIYNLFDTRDATFVYTDTGSPDYTTNITPERVPYNSKRVGTVESFVLRPDWYTAPREVQIGLSIVF